MKRTRCDTNTSYSEAFLTPPHFPCVCSIPNQVAARIVDDAVDELLLAVHTAAVKLGFAAAARSADEPAVGAWTALPEFDLVLAGGILQSEVMAALFKRAVRRSLPQARCLHPSVPAEMGSALLAWQSANQA